MKSYLIVVFLILGVGFIYAQDYDGVPWKGLDALERAREIQEAQWLAGAKDREAKWLAGAKDREAKWRAGAKDREAKWGGLIPESENFRDYSEVQIGSCIMESSKYKDYFLCVEIIDYTDGRNFWRAQESRCGDAPIRRGVRCPPHWERGDCVVTDSNPETDDWIGEWPIYKTASYYYHGTDPEKQKEILENNKKKCLEDKTWKRRWITTKPTI